jgi:hypothetical protein
VLKEAPLVLEEFSSKSSKELWYDSGPWDLPGHLVSPVTPLPHIDIPRWLRQRIDHPR